MFLNIGKLVGIKKEIKATKINKIINFFLNNRKHVIISNLNNKILLFIFIIIKAYLLKIQLSIIIIQDFAAKFKIVLIGDGAVGKTSFIKRHMTGEYNIEYIGYYFKNLIKQKNKNELMRKNNYISLTTTNTKINPLKPT